MAKKKPPKKSGGGGILVILLIVFLATHPSVLGSITGHGSPGASASCHKLERLWIRAGGNPSDQVYAADVAMAENSGQDTISPRNSNGTYDYGYWQINSSHGSLATLDPLGNAKAAVILSYDGTNWSAWVTVDNGLVQNVC